MERSPNNLGLMIVMLTLSASTGPTLGAQGSAALTGLVTYRGPLPLPQKITVNRDAAFCGATVTIQPLVVQATSQGVREAVVSLSEPPEQPLDAPPPPTIIKNRNCSFVSRISAARVGALVEIGNDDPVLHNTHIRGDGKTVLNVAMVPHGPNIQKQVKQPGLLDVKCDAHKFMQGYVMTFTHPFFSISDESGRFRIEGIPQGLHRITVWHETLGTLQKEVNVPAQGEISVHFNYP